MKNKFKRLLAIMLVLTLAMTLAACSRTENIPKEQNSDTEAETAAQPDTTSDDAAQQQEPQSETEEESSSSGETTDSAGSKILVVYFSRTGEQYTVGEIDKGNTAIVAEMIADRTGADLYEILPADDHYPMTYNELTDVAKREQKENARPEYVDEVPELSGYDTVFIGAPVWWGDWPMIMYTFFENNADALSGKTLIPFSTHEGSGLSGFDRALSSAIPGSTVLDGLAIRGNDAQNDQDNVRSKVDDWIAGLGY